MITEDDVRHLGKIKAENDEMRGVLIEYKKAFESLRKLFIGRTDPTQIYNEIEWLISLIERETGIDASKPEATIAVMKAFKVQKKNAAAKKQT